MSVDTLRPHHGTGPLVGAVSTQTLAFLQKMWLHMCVYTQVHRTSKWTSRCHAVGYLHMGGVQYHCS